MIKINEGGIGIEGSKITIMAEFTHLCNVLLHDKSDDGEPMFTAEDFDLCVKTAKLTREEFAEEFMKSREKATPEQFLAALLS